ncbi:MAG: GNAT family N-acetyltransferase [Cyanobacteria bacterium P01_H01_bin.105]
MIRFTAPDDTAAILALANAAIGFSPDELAELGETLTNYFDSSDEPFWLTDDDNGPVAAAYCAPERMTHGTWNLLFIAVHPEHQGQGRGTAMMHHVEKMLAARGAHLLLVETLASFDQTQAFYRRCGYEKEACIRDFYEVGADKIIYRKALVV